MSAAMDGSILPDWHEKYTRLWGKQPLRIQHTLHASPLFSMQALADLIDRYPREHLSLMRVGEKKKADRVWAETRTDRKSGSELIEAIANGRYWLNLRRVNDVDPQYDELLGQIFAELGRHVKTHDDFPLRSCGILISSPAAQVYYHADLPNQSLWQVAGRKKVYVYPSAEPFISGEDLERIAIYQLELDLPYADWYDEHARVFDLAPGEMLHWPLNAPHRVENLGTVNVSMTTEYWTRECARRYRVNMANGVMRNMFKASPRGRAVTGPTFVAKSLLWSAVSRTGWLERMRGAHNPADAVASRTAPARAAESEHAS